MLVVLPLYNARIYIRTAVESLISQTYPNTTFLMINDGSTDGSEKIVEGYKESKIMLWHQENQGPGSAMNRAIQYAQDNAIEFIARMDADDISLPNRIEVQVNLMLANPEAAACSANCYYIDPVTEKTIGTSTVSSNKKLIHWEINHGLRGLIQGATIFRTKPLNEIGGYRTRFVLAEETDLFLRLSEISDLINADSFLVKIRMNPNSLSVKNKKSNIMYQFYALECAKRRQRGEIETDFEQFQQELSPVTKYRIWREEKILQLWRQYFDTKNLPPLILSSLLDPRRVFVRILRVVL